MGLAGTLVCVRLCGYNITAFGLGGALGPWLGGYVFDATGHYTLAFWFALIITVIATLGVLILGRHMKRHASF